MGDLSVVDCAQDAHASCLAACGSWAEGARVLPQGPLPAGNWLELLTIDDHVGGSTEPGASAG
eukprot:9354930-Alexandrium_andersonii.AAC.1